MEVYEFIGFCLKECVLQTVFPKKKTPKKWASNTIFNKKSASAIIFCNDEKTQ